MIAVPLTPEIVQLRAAALDLREIQGPDGTPYCERYIIHHERDSRVYLHHFVADDWGRDMHDHPADFVSIGLAGEYVEKYIDGSYVNEHGAITPIIRYANWRAPWQRHFPATRIHRVELLDSDCWTLVHVGERTRDWGFWVDGEWVQWREYLIANGFPVDQYQLASGESTPAPRRSA